MDGWVEICIFGYRWMVERCVFGYKWMVGGEMYIWI